MMKPTKPGLSAILLACALLTDTETRADNYQLLTFTGETSANAAACSGPWPLRGRNEVRFGRFSA